MPLSPQQIRDTQFKASRRGYDPGEVDTFVEEVAAALETAQNEATAMEARARAAVARLQELSQQAPDAAGTGAPSRRRSTRRSTSRRRSAAPCCSPSARPTSPSPRRSAEADRLLAVGRDEAARSWSTSPAPKARRAGESERVQVEGEVQALLARRDFLESDVDHLEQYLRRPARADHRGRRPAHRHRPTCPRRSRRHAPAVALGGGRAARTATSRARRRRTAHRRRTATPDRRTPATPTTSWPRSPRSPEPAPDPMPPRRRAPARATTSRPSGRDR